MRLPGAAPSRVAHPPLPAGPVGERPIHRQDPTVGRRTGANQPNERTEQQMMHDEYAHHTRQTVALERIVELLGELKDLYTAQHQPISVEYATEFDAIISKAKERS